MLLARPPTMCQMATSSEAQECPLMLQESEIGENGRRPLYFAARKGLMTALALEDTGPTLLGARADTLLDVGVTHSTTACARTHSSIDTSSSTSKSWVGHARAANGYASRKESGYVKVIRDKGLDLSYCSFVVET